MVLNKYTITSIILGLFLSACFYYFFIFSAHKEVAIKAPSTSQQELPAIGVVASSTLKEQDATADVNIVTIDEDEVKKPAATLQYDIPSLTASITFADNVPANVRKIAGNNIDKLRAKLIENNTDVQNWMALALQHKIVGDYVMARDIWEFLTKVDISNAAVFYNLGSHYHVREKDFAKSESNFKHAIEVNKTNESYYFALHDLYKYSYKKDTDLAESTLLDAERLVPDSVDILIKLASYYKDTGKTKMAIDTYKRAQQMADTQGNKQLSADLSTVIAELSI